jgi:hypothetical protein
MYGQLPKGFGEAWFLPTVVVVAFCIAVPDAALYTILIWFLIVFFFALRARRRLK